MPYDRVDDLLIAVGKALLASTMVKYRDNQDYFNGQVALIGAVDIPNGSFEQIDGSNNPLSWDVTDYLGGSVTVDNTGKADGLRSLKCAHPGGLNNGGGEADSDYFPCSQYKRLYLSFLHWSTAAGMKNKVIARYFDKDQIFISQTELYTSTANPSAPTEFLRKLDPPSTARFLKIRVIGGFTDTDVAGDAFFDAITISDKIPVSGWRSNVVIQGSTNSSVYVDVASGSVSYPVNHDLPMVISSNGRLTGSSTGVRSGRLRVGTKFSNPNSSSSSNWHGCTWNIYLPDGLVGAGGTDDHNTTSLTMYCQGQVTVSGGVDVVKEGEILSTVVQA